MRAPGVDFRLSRHDIGGRSEARADSLHELRLRGGCALGGFEPDEQPVRRRLQLDRGRPDGRARNREHKIAELAKLAERGDHGLRERRER